MDNAANNDPVTADIARMDELLRAFVEFAPTHVTDEHDDTRCDLCAVTRDAKAFLKVQS